MEDRKLEILEWLKENVGLFFVFSALGALFLVGSEVVTCVAVQSGDNDTQAALLETEQRLQAAIDERYDALRERVDAIDKARRELLSEFVIGGIRELRSDAHKYALQDRERTHQVQLDVIRHGCGH